MQRSEQIVLYSSESNLPERAAFFFRLIEIFLEKFFHYLLSRCRLIKACLLTEPVKLVIYIRRKFYVQVPGVLLFPGHISSPYLLVACTFSWYSRINQATQAASSVSLIGMP